MVTLEPRRRVGDERKTRRMTLRKSILAEALAGDGVTLTYTPTGGFSGNTAFTYTIDDGNGGRDTATVSINVKKGRGGGGSDDGGGGPNCDQKPNHPKCN